MRVISTTTMTNDDAKHKNNANELLSRRTMTNDVARTMQMRPLRNRTMASEVPKDKNNDE